MHTLAIQEKTYFKREDYVLDANPKSIEEKYLKYYANLLDDFYTNLKQSSYSPSRISPKKAASLYSTVLWFEKSFSKLENLYGSIKNDSLILRHIYDNIIGIIEEFGEAKECLSKLKDPVKHEAILKTITNLQNSNFFNDEL